MRRSLSIIAVAVAAAFAAGPAHAQETLPEGNSAVDQYVDPLPGFDGDRPAGSPGAGGGGSGGGGGGGGASTPADEISDVPLPLRTQKKLAANGPDGFRVAGLVRDTAPGLPAGAADAQPKLAEGEASASRNSLLAGVIGGWLPAVMVLYALAVIALVILRRPRDPDPL